MLHFPAVPKDVELAQPLTDVLLLVPVDLPDQVLLTNQLLTLSLKQFLSIKSILKIHSSSSLQHYSLVCSNKGCLKKHTAAQSSALHPRVTLLQSLTKEAKIHHKIPKFQIIHIFKSFQQIFQQLFSNTNIKLLHLFPIK